METVKIEWDVRSQVLNEEFFFLKRTSVCS